MPKIDYDRLRMGLGQDAEFVSPSQLNSFRSCRRAWAHQYIDKIRKPQTPAQIRGEIMHEHLEKYIAQGPKYKIPNDLSGQMAQQLVPLIPNEAGHKEAKTYVEHTMILPINHQRKIYMVGAIDLIIETDEMIRVIDYKSTSNFKYALTPDKLVKDVQALCYTKYASKKFSCTQVCALWLYSACDKHKGQVAGVRDVHQWIDHTDEVIRTSGNK